MNTSAEWNTYRTRFLIQARQLTEPMAFVDFLGREHRGAPGDYLVQSSQGSSYIVARQIFEDIYVVFERPLAHNNPFLPAKAETGNSLSEAFSGNCPYPHVEKRAQSPYPSG